MKRFDLTRHSLPISTLSKGLLLLGLISSAEAVPQNQLAKSSEVTLPFSISCQEIKPVLTPTLPPLHSFTAAQANGKWLIFGGRVVGLHTFNPGQNNFPQNSQNLTAYVIDPSTWNFQHLDLTKTDLPQSLLWQLTSTNQESVQVGGDLFVVGGYGHQFTPSSATQAPMVTFGTMMKVNIAGLITAIEKQEANSLSQYITQAPAPDNRLMVTGGNLKFSQGVFYLVYGQSFDGYYSVNNGDYNKAGGQFQKYTEAVRAFTLNPDLSIGNFQTVTGAYDPNLPYHRRDLNVVDIIQSDGQTPGATIYGGVFMAGQFGGHLSPIDLSFSTNLSNINVSLQSNFKQGLSHYDCASVTLFDKNSSSSFTTLFGGISQFHYDAATNELILDPFNLPVDGMPFVNTVTTIQRGPNSTFSQYIQKGTLPGLLGTDAQFLVSPSTPTFPNGVIDLSRINGKTLVGYIYGGIESTAPYSGLPGASTSASNRIFAVYIDNSPGSVIQMPPVPSTVSAQKSKKTKTK